MSQAVNKIKCNALECISQVFKATLINCHKMHLVEIKTEECKKNKVKNIQIRVDALSQFNFVQRLPL